MIYILIVFWYGVTSSTSGKAAITAEFNSLQHCQAAAAELQRQARVDAIFCAAKGPQPQPQPQPKEKSK